LFLERFFTSVMNDVGISYAHIIHDIDVKNARPNFGVPLVMPHN